MGTRESEILGKSLTFLFFIFQMKIVLPPCVFMGLMRKFMCYYFLDDNKLQGVKGRCGGTRPGPWGAGIAVRVRTENAHIKWQ